VIEKMGGKSGHWVRGRKVAMDESTEKSKESDRGSTDYSTI